MNVTMPPADGEAPEPQSRSLPDPAASATWWGWLVPVALGLLLLVAGLVLILMGRRSG